MIFCVLNEKPERREGLKALLRQVNRQATALDARDWRQARHVIARANPDLLVIDWQSPAMQAQDLRLFLREHPHLPAAVLADDAATDADAVTTFLHAGVLGVIPRDLAPRLIVRAFELVLLGGHYVPAQVLDISLPKAPACATRHFESDGHALPRRPNLDGPSPLSPRQHQIMRLVHLGNTNKVIARALGISEGTVKIHLSSMFRLLGATNRAAAVAIYNGWQFKGLNVLRGTDPKPATAPVQRADALSRDNQESMRRWLFAAQPQAPYRDSDTSGTSSENSASPIPHEQN